MTCYLVDHSEPLDRLYFLEGKMSHRQYLGNLLPHHLELATEIGEGD